MKDLIHKPSVELLELHRISTDNEVGEVLRYRMAGRPEFIPSDDPVNLDTLVFWSSLPPIEQGGLGRMGDTQLLLAHHRCEDTHLPKVRAAILVRIWANLSPLSAA